MTISTETSRVTYTGNGATVIFPYNFVVPDADSMKVTLIEVNEVTGNIMTVLNPSVYQVTGLGNALGGTVKYPISGAGISSSYQLRIEREVPYTQETDFTNQDNFYPEVVEDAFDEVTMQVQQLKTIVDQVGDIEQYVSQAAAAAAIAQGGAGITGVPFLGTDVSGTNDVVVGTTAPVGFLAIFGARITFKAAATNTGAMTLEVGTEDPYDFYRMTPNGPMAMIGGEVVSGNMVDAIFDGAGFQLVAPAVYSNLPIGTSLEYTGPVGTVPTGFLLEYGQEVSRITYAQYYALVGDTYGAGNGTTTFNVRDKRDVVTAGKGNMGGAARGLLNSNTTLGAFQGSKEHTLTTAQIASHRHFAVSSTQGPSPATADAPIGQGTTTYSSNINAYQLSAGTGEATVGLTSSTGSGTAHNNVQPTINANFIVFVGV